MVPKDSLETAGDPVLKNGEPAVLHEFAGMVDCEGEPGSVAGKLLKPYIEFVGGPPRTIYRNWDPIAGNYPVGGPAADIDRGGELLQ
jgi:hypothetical protein